MVFQITNYCEMNCPHCMSMCTPEGQHAHFVVVQKVCEFINTYKPKMVLVSGGEPTQHPKFLEYFEYILRNTNCVIILTTNGYFLSKVGIKNQLIKLNKEFNFLVQVTAVKGLYKNTEKTKQLFKSVKRKFRMIELIEQMSVIDQLGRAAGKDWSKYTTYQRRAPNCFNFLSCVYSPVTSSFSDIVFQIHNANACKPFITPTGNVHISESHFCHQFGSIWDDDKTLYDNITKLEPCGKCGVSLDKFNDLKMFYKI